MLFQIEALTRSLLVPLIFQAHLPIKLRRVRLINVVIPDLTLPVTPLLCSFTIWRFDAP